MTKKNESGAKCKQYFLNLNKKIGITLRPWKLLEYKNLMKQFRSQKIKGDKLLRSLLVLFEDYDDLSQLFKELMKEEIEELRKNEIQETLTKFFNKVVKVDQKIHEAALYRLGMYGEGKMTLPWLKKTVVLILYEHEDLVGEFLEIFKDLTVATEEEADRERRKNKNKKKKRKKSKNDDEETEEEQLHLLPCCYEIALKETEKPMKKRSVHSDEYTPKPCGPMRPLWKSEMRRGRQIITSYNLFTKNN